MRTFAECIPCYLRQAVETLRLVGAGEPVVERVVREVARMAAEVDFAAPPPLASRFIYRLIREEIAERDPFLAAKRRFNETALSMYPRLEALVAASDDPFDTAARLAIAGNIIDLGAKQGLSEEEAFAAVDAALHAPFEGDTAALREAAERARNILYLADNAGEIVFDRLLVERLPMERVTLAVRGAPIINDALMEDARVAGLDTLVRVISNGADAPGTVLGLASEEFRAAFEAADLVISKGQGNYETVEPGPGREVFYLLKVKCAVIARDLGSPLGMMVLRPAARDGRSMLVEPQPAGES